MENDAITIAQGLGIDDADQAARDLIAFAAGKMAQHQQLYGGELAFVSGADLSVTHSFAPGICARTATIDGPCLFATVVHRTEHLHLMTFGEAYVWTMATGVEVFEAGRVTVTKPETFRLVFIPECARCTTIHRTDLTDPDDILAAIARHPGRALLTA